MRRGLRPADRLDAALNQQIVDLAEAFLDDITHLQAGQSFAETTLVRYLPRQFLPYYNLAFARRFLVACLTVTWKLTDPEAVDNCANQAEELAIYALIQATRDALPPGEDDLDAFEEAVYEDSDFVLLFDPSCVQGISSGATSKQDNASQNRCTDRSGHGWHQSP